LLGSMSKFDTLNDRYHRPKHNLFLLDLLKC
jgi:hypothetical protein